MTLQFNLLPWREEIRQKNKRSSQGFIFVGVLVGALLVGGYYYLKKAELSDSKKAVQILKKEVAALAPRLKEKKELEALREKLNHQIDSIESLQANRASVTHMVEELANAIKDKDVYLRSFVLRNGDVTINGYAKADTDISKLLISLQQSGWYLVPEVKTIKREEELGSETKSFEITSKLVLPGNDGGSK